MISDRFIQKGQGEGMRVVHVLRINTLAKCIDFNFEEVKCAGM